MTSNLVELQPIPIPKADHDAAIQRAMNLANNYVVDCDKTRELAISDIQKVTTYRDDLENTYKKIKDALKKALLPSKEYFEPKIDLLTEVRSIILKKVDAYTAEQKKKQQAIEEAAREEAKKIAAELAEKAKAVAEQGNIAEARVIEQQAAMLPAMAVLAVPAPTKADGQIVKTTWSAVIKDKKALSRAVADGVVHENAIDGNIAWLNTQARAYKAELNIPGVQAVSKTQSSIAKLPSD